MIQTLLKDIQEALDRHGNITREERQQIQELVRHHFAKGRITIGGWCLWCKEVEISYRVSGPHISTGDRYLKNLFALLDGATLNHVTARGTIKKRGLENIRGYLCQKCETLILGEIQEKRNQREVEQREHRAKKWEEHTAIVQKSVKATITQRFRSLTYVITEDYSDELQAMNYKDFLRSRYWSIIREYKMYLASYKCELCNGSGTLNIHHRTYEHRGREHLHLTDLITLCQNCHSKFHDKLPDERESVPPVPGAIWNGTSWT